MAAENDDEGTPQSTSNIPPVSLNHNDVLCGRGGTINAHPGNENFRKTVKRYRIVYLNARFKEEKRLIADTIVSEIRALDPPGRFLNKDSATGAYYEIGDAKARDKTSQALRENAPEIRAEIIGKKRATPIPKKRKGSTRPPTSSQGNSKLVPPRWSGEAPAVPPTFFYGLVQGVFYSQQQPSSVASSSLPYSALSQAQEASNSIAQYHQLQYPDRCQHAIVQQQPVLSASPPLYTTQPLQPRRVASSVSERPNTVLTDPRAADVLATSMEQLQGDATDCKATPGTEMESEQRQALVSHAPSQSQVYGSAQHPKQLCGMYGYATQSHSTQDQVSRHSGDDKSSSGGTLSSDSETMSDHSRQITKMVWSAPSSPGTMHMMEQVLTPTQRSVIEDKSGRSSSSGSDTSSVRRCNNMVRSAPSSPQIQLEQAFASLQRSVAGDKSDRASSSSSGYSKAMSDNGNSSFVRPLSIVTAVSSSAMDELKESNGQIAFSPITRHKS